MLLSKIKNQIETFLEIYLSIENLKSQFCQIRLKTTCKIVFFWWEKTSPHLDMPAKTYGLQTSQQTYMIVGQLLQDVVKDSHAQNKVIE